MPYRLPIALAGSLLLGAPHPGAAQATEPAPLPQYYVGLAAYNSDFQHLGGYYWRTGFGVPVQATFGYQLRPRWAVQAGLVYQGYSFAYDYTNRDLLTGGQYGPLYSASITERYRTFSASALARYTLTRKAAHRMQFDLLGGLTLEHYRNASRYTRTDSAAAPVATDSRYYYSQLLATTGLGLRYRFGQRLEATYNLLFSYGLTGYGSASPSYSDRLTSSAALGLQYRFGRR